MHTFTHTHTHTHTHTCIEVKREKRGDYETAHAMKTRRARRQSGKCGSDTIAYIILFDTLLTDMLASLGHVHETESEWPWEGQ